MDLFSLIPDFSSGAGIFYNLNRQFCYLQLGFLRNSRFLCFFHEMTFFAQNFASISYRYETSFERNCAFFRNKSFFCTKFNKNTEIKSFFCMILRMNTNLSLFTMWCMNTKIRKICEKVKK